MSDLLNTYYFVENNNMIFLKDFDLRPIVFKMLLTSNLLMGFTKNPKIIVIMK